VITNLPFEIIGLAGLFIFLRTQPENKYASVPYVILFIGVMGIGFGSAWYHYNPNNETLVWDRIPMTITFMSYFSIIITHYINRRLGLLILFPLLCIGVFSVFYWYITEQNGIGDLRLYAWVQFYPMLCIPLILFLYPASRLIRLKIVTVILVYAIAKMAEHADEAIFNSLQVISGHSLKHVLASASVLLILLTIRDEPHRSDLTTHR
jgi:hypothetical protein